MWGEEVGVGVGRGGGEVGVSVWMGRGGGEEVQGGEVGRSR